MARRRVLRDDVSRCPSPVARLPFPNDVARAVVALEATETWFGELETASSDRPPTSGCPHEKTLDQCSKWDGPRSILIGEGRSYSCR